MPDFQAIANYRGGDSSVLALFALDVRASPLCRSRSPDLDLSTKLLTRLRSGDRKLQALIGPSIDIKVLTDLENARRVCL